MAKIGVILANLGTPDSPTPKAVSHYLGEFLSDPRVVDVAQPKWGIILRFIRFFRSPKVAKVYQEVWNEEGSPLLAISNKQRDALQQALETHFPEHQWRVVVGMTYGSPAIKDVAQQMFAHELEHIILLPAYPQFSSTTVLPVIDQFNRSYANKNQRYLPPFSIVNNYAAHPLYIQALANSIKRHVAGLQKIELVDEQALASFSVDRFFSAEHKLFLSYHGIPTRFAEQLKDPYPEHCSATTAAVVKLLNLRPEQYQQTYQSVFGKEPWLVPQTDVTLEAHAKAYPNAGAVVICPGFAVDCIETLEEIGMQNYELFMESGGKEYSMVTCLNDHPEHIAMFVEIIKPYLATLAVIK